MRRFRAFWGVFKRFHFGRFEAPGFVQVVMTTLFMYAQNTCIGLILCLTSTWTLTRLNSLSFQRFTVIWFFLTSLESLRHFLCYYWAVCFVLALLGAFCLLLLYRVGSVPTRSLFAQVILTICFLSSSDEFLFRKNLCKPISSADSSRNSTHRSFYEVKINVSVSSVEMLVISPNFNISFEFAVKLRKIGTLL